MEMTIQKDCPQLAAQICKLYCMVYHPKTRGRGEGYQCGVAYVPYDTHSRKFILRIAGTPTAHAFSIDAKALV